MASRDLKDAHPTLVEQFQKAKTIFEQRNPGVQVVVTCTHRSPEEQNKLYNQPFDNIDNDKDGKVDEKDEKVTQARAFQSPHNFLPSYAIDVAFIVNGKTDWNTKWFKLFSVHMVHPQIDWGGQWRSFQDLPHYELKGWKGMIKK